MAEKLVVGLFESSGIALDAYHRLRTEGVPASQLAHRVLKETGPVPAVLTPELQALQIDPIVLGDARNTFARFIHNGETAVFVRIVTADDAEFAAGILKLYAPVAIETIAPSEDRNIGAADSPPLPGTPS